MTTTEPMTTEPLLIDGAEAARLLCTTLRHLKHLRLSNQLAVVRVGGLVRYRRADLDAFIRSNTAPAAPAA